MDAHAIGGAGVVGEEDSALAERPDGGVAETPLAHVLPVLIEIDVLLALRQLGPLVVELADRPGPDLVPGAAATVDRLQRAWQVTSAG